MAAARPRRRGRVLAFVPAPDAAAATCHIALWYGRRQHTIWKPTRALARMNRSTGAYLQPSWSSRR
eukprot:scaffold69321_cov73-Phaeocystis_antarctica.AAC.3